MLMNSFVFVCTVDEEIKHVEAPSSRAFFHEEETEGHHRLYHASFVLHLRMVIQSNRILVLSYGYFVVYFTMSKNHTLKQEYVVNTELITPNLLRGGA